MVHLHPEGFEHWGLTRGSRIAAIRGGVRRRVGLLRAVQFAAAHVPDRRLIGAITDTLRLELQDFNVAPEMATFIGAFLAGILASVWRSSVRRGWLPPHLGYPRICLTVRRS